MKERDIIKKLHRIASKSNMRFKMGAIIYNDNWILGAGYNYRIPMNSTKRLQGNFSIHAEVMALYRALHRHGENIVKNSHMVVYRRSPSGMANSKPCERCKRLLEKYNLKIRYVENGKWAST